MCFYSNLVMGEESNSAAREVNITFETLFDLLRREKNREELQKMEPSFYADVISYLKEKITFLEEKNKQGDLFAASDRDKAKREFDNIKRILRDLYELREKKIISIAINKSRSGSDIIDNSALLDEEKKMYSEFLQILNNYREGILFNLTNAKLPEIKEIVKEEKKVEVEKQEVKQDDKTTRMVRFLHAVPKFLGKELEVYGPFEEEDIANLPVEIANVLINKERALEIKEKE